MNSIIETSLYYEDLIEEHVYNNSNNPDEIKLFSDALRVGKQGWYNKKMGKSANQKESIQSDFKESMKVDLNTINNSPSLSYIKIEEDLENEKIMK